MVANGKDVERKRCGKTGEGFLSYRTLKLKP